MPIYSFTKCITDGDTFKLKNKQCSEYPINECFNLMATSKYHCLPDLDKKFEFLKNVKI